MKTNMLSILLLLIMACGLITAVSLSQVGEKITAVASEQLDQPDSGMDLIIRSRTTAPAAPRSALAGLLWGLAMLSGVGLIVYYLSLRQKAILAKEARLKEAQILKRRNGPPRPMMQPRITDHYLPNGQSHPPNHDGGYYGQ
jgi:hypothetical protein